MVIHNLYLYFCTAILCVIFQIIYFLINRKNDSGKVSIKKIILVYIFLIPYLSLVYDVTTIYGVFWRIWESGTANISMERVFLIPFTTVPISNPLPYLLNILMTIPLGFLLPVIWSDFRSLKKVMLAVFLLSLTIETAQLFTGWRLSATDDLIANTLGAMVGYFMFKVMLKVFKNLENNSIPSKIKNESTYYLILSFVGAFFLYYNDIIRHLRNLNR